MFDDMIYPVDPAPGRPAKTSTRGKTAANNTSAQSLHPHPPHRPGHHGLRRRPVPQAARAISAAFCAYILRYPRIDLTGDPSSWAVVHWPEPNPQT